MLDDALALAESALSAPSAEAASLAFHAIAIRHGASYLQTRLYRRPQARLTPQAHWQAGGFVTRQAPDDWPDSDGFRYVCLDCNPLVGAIREGRTTYRFSDFAPRDDRRFGAYWEAFSQARIGDALCATAYGAQRTIASLHLGFADGMPDPETERLLRFAGLILTEQLLRFAPPGLPAPPPLTPRERDALLYVAEGKTDWEIGCILGLSAATARFHVDNARRKLGAVNRAHAVARLVAIEGPL